MMDTMVLPLSERERLLMTPYQGWPRLAAQWLAAGHDSPTLRDFAALTPAQGALLADLMSDVLASLGVPVRVGVPITKQLPLITDFEARCREALDVAARDVTRTWGELDLGLHVFLADEEPTLIVSVTVAGRNQPGDQDMTLWTSTLDLPSLAADGIRETLLVHFGVKWPLCKQHQAWTRPGPPVRDDHPEDPNPQLAASWWCPASDGHVLAPIGELPAAAVEPPERPARNLAPPAWWSS